MDQHFKSIVVLIDSDNTQLSKLQSVIDEINSFGRIIVKRAYGNWKKDLLKNWEDELKRLAIKAEQQFDYVTGKNATDMALIIDAIELLHRNLYDAFAIVSSDSDYTPLAIKLRESGVFVIGVGEKKTPEPFIRSCDEFVYIENLSYTDISKKPSHDNAEEEIIATASEEDFEEIHRLLKIASDKYQDDDGFVNVSSAGTFIKRTKPDFDARSYGYVKLPKLIEAFPEKYEMKKYAGKGTVQIIAYRCLDEQ